MISRSEVVWAAFSLIALLANSLALWDAHADVRAMRELKEEGGRLEINLAARANALQLWLVQAIFFSIALVAMTAPEPVRQPLQFYLVYASFGLFLGEVILAFNAIWTMAARRRSMMQLIARNRKEAQE